MENRYLTRLMVIFIITIMAAFGYGWYAAQQRAKLGPSGLPARSASPTDLAVRLQGQGSLKRFASMQELKNFLQARTSSDGSYSGNEVLRGTTDSISVPEEFAGFSGQDVKSSPMADMPAYNESDPDYSRTNVQVEGVDEADIVKSDGTYLYIVSQNNVFIVAAYPAQQANVLSKIQFNKITPQNIYIQGNSLVVYGTQYGLNRPELTKIVPPYRSNFTFVKVFDITDRKNPKQVREMEIEGGFTNSRLVGDYMYLITTKYGYDGGPIPLPIIIHNGSADNVNQDKPEFTMPPVYYFDADYDSANVVNVTAVNVKNAGEKYSTEAYVMDSAQAMYMSPKNLYLTYTKHVSEEELMLETVKSVVVPRLSADDQAKIRQIEAAPDYVLNRYERTQKIMMILEKYVRSLPQDQQDALEKEVKDKAKIRYQEIKDELEKTVIHRIAIDKNKLEHKAQGEVTGYVLNQYSMDEYNGYFRIATTRSRQWSQFADENDTKSYSNVTVLDQNLKQTGLISNLASDEQIFSARFMGDRAFLVTYRQTDPFFVLDLKDPKNPTVVGELKIPGFSNYLHPYDDTTIIGIGRETKEVAGGRVQNEGVKISLFDVSNVSEPKEVAKYVFAEQWSDSEALHDPKAFLFSKDKNLLVIPVTINNNMYGTGERVDFRGAAVFAIEKNKIELKGKVNHYDVSASKIISPYYQDEYYGYYDSTVRRSAYIHDTLYTVSSVYVKMNNLSDLKEVKKLELKKERAD